MIGYRPPTTANVPDGLYKLRIAPGFVVYSHRLNGQWSHFGLTDRKDLHPSKLQYQALYPHKRIMSMFARFTYWAFDFAHDKQPDAPGVYEVADRTRVIMYAYYNGRHWGAPRVTKMAAMLCPPHPANVVKAWRICRS